MKKLLLSTLTAGMLFAGNNVNAQQISFPSPSTTSTIKQQFATSFVELSYSRPSVKGRVIFGGLVPFEQIWRTGANSATTIEFGQDVIINNQTIAKGKYGLLTIPNEKQWTIIITKDLNVTGAGSYKQENDVVRVEAPVSMLTDVQETFTIECNNITDNSFSLDLKWDKTKVSVAVTANFDAELVKQIEKTMSNDTRPYYAAASYYYNNRKDMKKALEWINKADELTPGRYWVQTLKAKIQFENQLYTEAVETAEQAKANAEKAGVTSYVNDLNALIENIKKNPAYKAPKGKKK
ncbi:MAG: DUF2911 domain-containing protein [Bacteroidia bacterium]|nr:DUF2911 domain-containing protein [Bacteroidia bacterium]